MNEINDRTWKKYMDRAIKECSHKTINMLENLPPKVASVMLIQIGEQLCLEDDWKTITKQMRLTLKERVCLFLKKVWKRR